MCVVKIEKRCAARDSGGDITVRRRVAAIVLIARKQHEIIAIDIVFPAQLHRAGRLCLRFGVNIVFNAVEPILTANADREESLRNSGSTGLGGECLKIRHGVTARL